MSRSARGTSSTVTTLLAISVAIVSTVAVLGAAAVGSHVLSLGTEANAAATATTVVNRERKSDALPVSQAAQERLEIKSVEVVGLRDAAIVYRDRDGNVLFKTDPLANVTVVTKNVDLPAVTIRSTADSEVERFDARKPIANPLEAAPSSPPPPGCESAFARPSPEALTNKTGRCLASL